MTTFEAIHLRELRGLRGARIGFVFQQFYLLPGLTVEENVRLPLLFSRRPATPGRIVLEMEASTSGRVIKRGRLKVWTGAVPVTPIDEAVEQSRHYTR